MMGKDKIKKLFEHVFGCDAIVYEVARPIKGRVQLKGDFRITFDNLLYLKRTLGFEWANFYYEEERIYQFYSGPSKIVFEWW